MSPAEYETECRARSPLPELAMRLGVNLSTLYRRFQAGPITGEMELAIRAIPKARAKKSSRNAPAQARQPRANSDNTNQPWKHHKNPTHNGLPLPASTC